MEQVLHWAPCPCGEGKATILTVYLGWVEVFGVLHMTDSTRHAYIEIFATDTGETTVIDRAIDGYLFLSAWVAFREAGRDQLEFRRQARLVEEAI